MLTVPVPIKAAMAEPPAKMATMAAIFASSDTFAAVAFRLEKDEHAYSIDDKRGRWISEPD